MIGYDNWDDEPRTEMRSAAAIKERLGLVAVQVWYDQYRDALYEWLWEEKPVSSEVAEGAAENARRVREMYDEALLGPWSDYEWGVLNGRLAALRWLLGYDSDLLDD